MKNLVTLKSGNRVRIYEKDGKRYMDIIGIELRQEPKETAKTKQYAYTADAVAVNGSPGALTVSLYEKLPKASTKPALW